MFMSRVFSNNSSLSLQSIVIAALDYIDDKDEGSKHLRNVDN